MVTLLFKLARFKQFTGRAGKKIFMRVINKIRRFEYALASANIYLRAIQPDLIFRVIDNAGHWTCYEAPEEFNTTYFEMLREIGS